MVSASSRIPRGNAMPSKRIDGDSGAAGAVSTPLENLRSVIVMCRSSLVCSSDRQVVASDPQRGVGLDQTPLRVLATTRRLCTSPRVDADGRPVQLHYRGVGLRRRASLVGDSHPLLRQREEQFFHPDLGKRVTAAAPPPADTLTCPGSDDLNPGRSNAPQETARLLTTSL